MEEFKDPAEGTPAHKTWQDGDAAVDFVNERMLGFICPDHPQDTVAAVSLVQTGDHSWKIRYHYCCEPVHQKLRETLALAPEQ